MQAAKLNKLHKEEVQLSMILAQNIVEEDPLMLCSIEAYCLAQQVAPAIEKLLTEFADVFAEPTSIRPFRNIMITRFHYWKDQIPLTNVLIVIPCIRRMKLIN